MQSNSAIKIKYSFKTLNNSIESQGLYIYTYICELGVGCLGVLALYNIYDTHVKSGLIFE